MANNVDEALARLTKNPQEYASTIAGNIERIEDSKLVIVDKLHQMIDLESDSSIDDAAIAMAASITIISEGSAKISQGQSYTVPEGYYNGTFKVVADGEGQDLDHKTVTPTKAQQLITPDSGFYGLADVTVEAIPAKYQDVTSVTAAATDVLTGKKIVNSAGQVIDGLMANNGKVTQVLDATTGKQSYTIDQGYHNGQGTVSIVLEEKTVDPTESLQDITPTSGKVLSKVTVAAINKTQYLTSWTNDATAVAANILTGKTAYAKGAKVTGTMTDNSSWDAAEHILDTTTSGINISVPQGYHAAGGVVKVVTEDKSVSFSESEYKAGISLSASEGKVIKNVTIAPLPASYFSITDSNTTATADDVLAPKTFINPDGDKVTGNILTETSYNQDISDEVLNSGASGYTLNFNEAFYKNGGSVEFDNSLFSRLAAI